MVCSSSGRTPVARSVVATGACLEPEPALSFVAGLRAIRASLRAPPVRSGSCLSGAQPCSRARCRSAEQLLLVARHLPSTWREVGRWSVCVGRGLVVETVRSGESASLVARVRGGGRGRGRPSAWCRSTGCRSGSAVGVCGRGRASGRRGWGARVRGRRSHDRLRGRGDVGVVGARDDRDRGVRRVVLRLVQQDPGDRCDHQHHGRHRDHGPPGPRRLPSRRRPSRRPTTPHAPDRTDPRPPRHQTRTRPTRPPERPLTSPADPPVEPAAPVGAERTRESQPRSRTPGEPPVPAAAAPPSRQTVSSRGTRRRPST